MATPKKTAKKSSKKTSTPSNLVNHVAIILDRSGSMSTIRDATIRSFNEQVETINKVSKGQTSRVSLITFSTEVDQPTHFEANPSALTPLDQNSYVPNGSTALYDAVGSTIERLQGIATPSGEDHAFLVVIISDGEENYSRKFDSKRLSELIQACQNKGNWTFSYIGANVDLSKIAQTLHIPVGNTQSFTASSVGTATMSATLSSNVGSYYSARSRGAKSTSSFSSGSSDQN